MSVAIVQPYIFPYLGYFQLIKEVDSFVFYDDVNFIKRGWINRNNLRNKREPYLFSIPLSKVSQNKKINEVKVALDQKWINGFYRSLDLNYKKAKNYHEVFELVKTVFSSTIDSAADLSALTCIEVSKYLGIETQFYFSSHSFSDSIELDRADRLIQITKDLNSDIYINPAGGKSLYDFNYFSNQGVKLKFLQSLRVEYPQFNWEFIPDLSILDVLMHNSIEEVNYLLDQYSLDAN